MAKCVLAFTQADPVRHNKEGMRMAEGTGKHGTRQAGASASGGNAIPGPTRLHGNRHAGLLPGMSPWLPPWPPLSWAPINQSSEVQAIRMFGTKSRELHWGRPSNGLPKRWPLC